MEEIAGALVVNFAEEALRNARDAHPIKRFAGNIFTEVLREVRLCGKDVARFGAKVDQGLANQAKGGPFNVF